VEKSLFERMGGTYNQEGDYFLPVLSVPELPAIGIWGQRRKRYLKEHRHRHMGTAAETVSERTPSGPLYGVAAVWQVEQSPVRNRRPSEKYVFSACGADS